MTTEKIKEAIRCHAINEPSNMLEHKSWSVIQAALTLALELVEQEAVLDDDGLSPLGNYNMGHYGNTVSAHDRKFIYHFTRQESGRIRDKLRLPALGKFLKEVVDV